MTLEGDGKVIALKGGAVVNYPGATASIEGVNIMLKLGTPSKIWALWKFMMALRLQPKLAAAV